MKRVQIRMRTSQDTLRKCEELDQDWGLYFGGYTRPHFKMPAVISQVDYVVIQDKADCCIIWDDYTYSTIWRDGPAFLGVRHETSGNTN